MEGVEVEVTHPKGNTTHEHVRLAVKDRQEWFCLAALKQRERSKAEDFKGLQGSEGHCQRSVHTLEALAMLRRRKNVV